MSEATRSQAGIDGDSSTLLPTSIEHAPALDLRSVTKTYPGVRALTDVSLQCFPGEVHALVGENGSGKSTLIKVASGAVRADSGTVYIGGRPLHRALPRAARSAGLLTAYQDTALVPELTAAENIELAYAGVRDQGLVLHPARARQLLAGYKLDIPFDVPVATLSPAARQMLEVARCLAHDPKVLLLDEPTASLDADNIRRLEMLIAQACARGTAVLYISHRLDEVRRIAGRLSVLRDGTIQGTYVGSGWEIDEIVAMMIGAPTELAFPAKCALRSAEPTLVVTGLRSDEFGPVHLTVHRGEIVGIAGAEGNGQRELARALAGQLPAAGSIVLDGHELSFRSPGAAVRGGVAFVSGDRAREANFAELSVMDNTLAVAGGRLGPVGLAMRGKGLSIFQPIASDLGIVAAGPDQPIGQLSGGNQQKAIFGRTMARDARLLIVDEPTQGVDARARLDIFRALRSQAEAGVITVVNSSDSAELSGLCDRVYVVSRGSVVTVVEGDAVTEAAIVSAFVGATESGSARGADRAGRRHGAAPWLPPAVIGLLILILAVYAAAKSPVFTTQANMSALLVTCLPICMVAVAQQAALLTGGFDISVGSNMSVTVVLASFVITHEGVGSILGGVVLCLLLGTVIGLVNAFIVRALAINAIIATIATSIVLAGLAVVLRPTPGGAISSRFTALVSKQIGPVPVMIVVLAVVAVVADLAMLGTPFGLAVRGSGLSEEPARRSGVRTGRVKTLGFVVCGVGAAAAGLILAAQVGVGSNAVGAGFPLTAFAACFLGGAQLSGGRGSFGGALLGGVLLGLLTNIAPLVGIQDEWSQIITGIVMIAAVGFYIAPVVGRLSRIRRSSGRRVLAS